MVLASQREQRRGNHVADLNAADGCVVWIWDGRAFAPGLDIYITKKALARHACRLTPVKEGRSDPASELLTYTADFTWPKRWWIAGTDGTPPRESSRYERARVASLAVQNAIRAARTTAPTAPTAPDGAPAAAGTTTVTEHRDQEEHDPAPPHAVDHPGRDTALTPKQRAEATQAHLQAAMLEEYLEGRTTDAGTWLRTPENLERLAAFTRVADARRRAYEDNKPPAAPDVPADGHRQEHEQQHRQAGHGQSPGPRP
ncbi:hypothetical protein [Streptomyces cinereoruber]|uniref:hypothetical protein n=1 Tax=Streptomyces cinereoruber TaxID=67260 RepID=UPI00362676DF